jgi:exodeoxyribonuclease VII large subunit
MTSPPGLPFDDDPMPIAEPIRRPEPSPAPPRETRSSTGAGAGAKSGRHTIPGRDTGGAVVPPIEVTPEPRRIYSVSELTGAIRGLLEGTFGEVWVEGELSNCRVWNTGHLYLTLKDSGTQLKGVMFRTALRALRFEPKDGLRVVARGRIGVYEPKGEYQIVCEHMEPEGLGALQLAFDQLKARLSAEGLFDPRRKRPLPALPRKIGIVTSIDGAAVRDIIKVLRRRYPNVHLVIRSTRVQGEGSALEIARAIGAIGKVEGVDVVIVGRGGGSIEDLWAFNEEVVARAIAGCPVPTIAAVGHESDVTIADFVADVRAATPSAAAEIVVARKDAFTGRIDSLSGRLESSITHRTRACGSRLHQLEARPGYAGFHGHLALRARHASELTHTLGRVGLSSVDRRRRALERLLSDLDTHDLRRRLAGVRTGLVAVDGRMGAAVTRRRFTSAARLGDAAARLDSLSPLAVLGRGYAVCWNADRTAIVRDASTVGPGDAVQVTLSKGSLTCEVRDRTYGPDDSGF